MKLFKSWLLLALVFFAGIVVGVVGTRIVVRHVVREMMLRPDKAQTFLERNLAGKLKLDNGQQVKLHQILSDAHAQLKNLRGEYQPQFYAVVSNASRQITVILTTGQQARFEKLQSENPQLFSPAQPSR